MPFICWIFLEDITQNALFKVLSIVLSENSSNTQSTKPCFCSSVSQTLNWWRFSIQTVICPLMLMLSVGIIAWTVTQSKMNLANWLVLILRLSTQLEHLKCFWFDCVMIPEWWTQVFYGSFLRRTHVCVFYRTVNLNNTYV